MHIPTYICMHILTYFCINCISILYILTYICIYLQISAYFMGPVPASRFLAIPVPIPGQQAITPDVFANIYNPHFADGASGQNLRWVRLPSPHLSIAAQSLEF